MIQINNLNANPFQTMTLVGESGEIIPFYLWYSSREIGWFYNISYGNNFSVNGRRLCVSPNALYQWQNIIPFGLVVSSTDGDDPFYLNDFISGRINLYILNATEVIEFNAVK